MTNVLSFVSTIILAMIEVEGDGSPEAVRGDSVGILQLKRIFVDQVNKIQNHERFSYEDRKNRVKSIRMTRIWIEELLKNHPEYSLKEVVLAFKCGPSGMMKANDQDLDHAQRVQNLVEDGLGPD